MRKRGYVCECPNVLWDGLLRHRFLFLRKKDAEKQCLLCRRGPFSGDNNTCGPKPWERVDARCQTKWRVKGRK